LAGQGSGSQDVLSGEFRSEQGWVGSHRREEALLICQTRRLLVGQLLCLAVAAQVSLLVGQLLCMSMCCAGAVADLWVQLLLALSARKSCDPDVRGFLCNRFATPIASATTTTTFSSPTFGLMGP
ncbi:unnamed protein product, partial [Polarella glacialis]